MNRIGLDTNVIVSFVTDRDPSRQAQAAELFSGAASGDHVLVLHQAVITETVYVLCNLYETPPQRVSAVLRDLLSLPGVLTADQLDWPAIWDSWPRRIKSFGDACLTAAAKAGAFDRLATFDAAFAKRARRQGIRPYWKRKRAPKAEPDRSAGGA